MDRPVGISSPPDLEIVHGFILHETARAEDKADVLELTAHTWESATTSTGCSMSG